MSEFRKWTAFSAQDLAGMLASNPYGAVRALFGFAAGTRAAQVVHHARSFPRDPDVAAFYRAFADAVDPEIEPETTKETTR